MYRSKEKREEFYSEKGKVSSKEGEIVQGKERSAKKGERLAPRGENLSNKKMKDKLKIGRLLRVWRQAQSSWR